MNKLTKRALLVVASLAITACGGGGDGGGSVSTGGVYYTHDQLAQEFVRRVNVDVSGFNLELVKSNTLQTDYIVVYDHDYGTYDAYYIGNYHVGQDLNSYLVANQNYFYYDLVPQGGNVYQDYYTGILFEKVQASGKNLAKMKALKEDLAINKVAQTLRATYGMSVEKSVDTARFAYKMKTSPAGTYNAKDYDAFSKELTGSTITEFQSDVKAGNMASLNDRMEKAGQTTGMGSEGVNKLIKDMFMGQN